MNGSVAKKKDMHFSKQYQATVERMDEDRWLMLPSPLLFPRLDGNKVEVERMSNPLAKTELQPTL